ncbi:MAG TPA: PepSY-associated TM helix domain-containing protein [Arenimonas sp.]|uniref:PepSY-associated TM helix domain-containing protein n=1 Tax=Arenimonas sp. TaxID=1872635 RepID=UPI002D7FBF9A|nr:PepSY-associated TM helix domain-containing protein [Arenimonas sp.]HEU0153540.1 PepSY-associated TM helix domain-containing protein [Arenimonas sp.]
MPDGARVSARGNRPRLRSALAWLHLWVGLAVGTVFALVSLAGSVLVFHTELLVATRPVLAEHSPVADGAVMGRLLTEWQPRGLTALDLPREGLPVWQGYLADGRRAYFAPEDGRLLLLRSHQDDWLMWLHHWHVELLGGPTGKAVLGIVGWMSLGLLASGLYLWWPKRGRMLAQLRWHAGPPVRRWLSWHRSSGVLALPLLGLATLTGVGMVYPNAFRTVLVAALGEHPAPVAAAGAAAPGEPDWRAVLATADTALPGARLARISAPAPDATSLTFRAQAEGEWHPVGRSVVGVSRDGREVLLRHDATADRPGARLSHAIYPLHVAAVGGPGMKIALLIAGCLPLFLLITGFLFWRRRRAGR